MNPTRCVRLRTLASVLEGALAYAIAAGDRRWWRTLARRHARVTRELARCV